jgi:SNF2 family DNA or RNA helicase
MKASERQQVIDCFSDAKDDKNNPKYKREVRFLIGTTLAMGKGLGLTRARNVILMEPHNFTTESQAYGRVDRIGQRNPISGSYRLIDVGSEIEQKIIQRQINRNESYGRAIDSAEDAQTGAIGLGITI